MCLCLLLNLGLSRIIIYHVTFPKHILQLTMDHLPALLIIFSVITFLLCIQPLVWQIKHYNVASGCLISWTILLLFVNFLNASLWPSVDSVKSYMGLGLCDVEIKLIIAAWVGVTGSAAAMLRHLAKILDISSTTSLTSLSKKEKIIDRIIVYGMCVGLPFLLAATHILVQPSRYMLVSIAGCIPTVARSWPGTLFLYLLLLINGVSGTVYAGENSSFPLS
jgi:pheromone a factor receptor